MFEMMLSKHAGHRTQIYHNPKGQIEIFMGRFGEYPVFSILDPQNRSMTPEVRFGRKATGNFTKLQSGHYADLVFHAWTKEEKQDKVCFGAGFAFARSEDGETWEDTLITQEVGSYHTFNNRILQLGSGRIIVPVCYEPQLYTKMGEEKGGWIGTFWSDDEGLTWQRSPWVEGDSCHHHMAEPICVDLGDNLVKMFSRTADGYLFECVSRDGGENWEPETPTTLRMPCSPFVVLRDPFSGYVFVLWNNSFPGPIYQYPRSPFCMAVSRDNTKTWELVCEIENDPFCIYGYPSMLFTEHEIMITYDIVLGTRAFDKEKMYPKLKCYRRDELTVRKEYTEPLF